MRDSSRLSGRYNLCSKSMSRFREMRLIEQVPHLEGVAEAELELPFRGIGSAFAGHFSKRAAGWAHVWVIPIGVVDVVEALGLEDQRMVLVARDNVEVLLERGIVALEAGAADDVAGAATGKGTGGCGLKDAGCCSRTATRTDFKPLSGGAELGRQVWWAWVHVVLIPRTWSSAGLVKVPRNIS